MGMFDDIIIDDPSQIRGLEKPLAEQKSSNRPQTKDLENVMAKFIIKDGRLYKEFKRYEYTDEPEEIQILKGYVQYKRRLVEEWVSPYPFHGDISILAWTEDEERVYLIARFSYDKLDYIKVDENMMAWEAERQKKYEEAQAMREEKVRTDIEEDLREDS